MHNPDGLDWNGMTFSKLKLCSVSEEDFSEFVIWLEKRLVIINY